MMKGVLAGVGAIGLLLGASGVQAQTCTMNNWSSSVGATNLKVGTVADGNRRYAGPCGLNVALDGAEAYLEDTTPVDETEFNVRFYFFLNDVVSDVTFYQALDGSAAVITAKYDASEDAVDVVFGASQATLSLSPVSSGWNSLEIKWTSDAAAEPEAILASAAATIKNAFSDTSSVIDTSAFAVDSARLGASNAIVGSVPSAGSIDFDDYDSRRDTVPGRVCRGLTDPDRAVGNSGFQELKFEDIDNIFSEIASRGSSPAGGVPDFDQDGSVKFSDLDAVFARIAARQVSCDVNS